MGSFKIVLRASAGGDLRTVPFPFRRQVVHAIERLKKDPRPSPSEAIGDSYRPVVYGWWVLYDVDDATSIVMVHGIVH